MEDIMSWTYLGIFLAVYLLPPTPLALVPLQIAGISHRLLHLIFGQCKLNAEAIVTMSYPYLRRLIIEQRLIECGVVIGGRNSRDKQLIMSLLASFLIIGDGKTIIHIKDDMSGFKNRRAAQPHGDALSQVMERSAVNLISAIANRLSNSQIMVFVSPDITIWLLQNLQRVVESVEDTVQTPVSHYCPPVFHIAVESVGRGDINLIVDDA